MQDEEEELGITVGSEEMEEMLSGIDEVRVNTNMIYCVLQSVYSIWSEMLN